MRDLYSQRSEEGLEQEFNSLRAQREACEAFITSQRHEGWVCLPKTYDMTSSPAPRSARYFDVTEQGEGGIGRYRRASGWIGCNKGRPGLCSMRCCLARAWVSTRSDVILKMGVKRRWGTCRTPIMRVGSR
jgi:hypothetical protein